MRSGTRFEQMDILIVPFPFTDLSGFKQRPVLVLSSNEYNRKTNDIVTCGITSNLKDADYSVLITNDDLDEGSIPARSRIKVDKIFTLDQGIVKKKVAKVNEKVLGMVKEKLFRLFS